MEPGVLWTVAAAVGLGNLIKGALGFGSAIVALPIAGLVLAPADAMVVVAGVDVGSGVWLAWRARADVPAREVGYALLGVLPTQWLGTGLQAVWPERIVQRVVGAAVLGLAAWMVWRERQREAGAAAASSPATPWGAAWAGAQGGLLSGLVGMPGPPLVAWAQRSFEPRVARGFQLGLFLPGSLVLIAMLLGRGLATPEAALSAIGLIPVAWAAAWVGERAGRRLERAVFVWSGAGVVAAAAVMLLWRSG